MNKVLFVLLWILPTFSYSQTVEKSVISSDGGTKNVGNYTFEYTIGECVISNLNVPTLLLTQGFHQPEIEISASLSVASIGLNIRAYPVPTKELLTIELESERAIPVKLVLVNSNGSEVMPLFSLNAEGATKKIVDISSVSSGVYYVRLVNTEGYLQETIRIIKMD